MADPAEKTVITEQDIRGAAIGSTLRIGHGTLVTPLAADLARERRIVLERVAAGPPQVRRKVAIGADHGGYEMKEAMRRMTQK